MKIWHDDVRLPPDGWEWARTNAEAIALLEANEVDEISLDHDLGLDFLEPDAENVTLRGGSPEGTGYDLVLWMVENDKVPASVRVHSWSPSGALRMAAALRDAGHYGVEIRPYDLKERVRAG